MKASDLLTTANDHLAARAKTYDAPQGERSMARTVSMFNTLTGNNVSEVDGWQFMELLKMVRSRQGNFKADNFEDGAAYASLAGEAAYNAQEQSQKPVVQLVSTNSSEVSANVHNKSSSKATADRRKKAVQKTAAKRRTR